jgi:tetratricopeptide (TPR) repeat protein
MIEQLLAEQYRLYNENPENLNVVRRIADLHEQKDDYEGAIQYYQWAVQLTQSSDPGLLRKVNDLTLKNLDRQIQSREDWLRDHAGLHQTNGDTPDEETRETNARLQTELTEFKRQKAEMLVNSARQRVERNPTDLTFRYELGEQLVKAGQFTEAIAELQKSQNSPNLGLKSKYLLGQCFEAKNILNLAVKQYEDVRAKLPNMDAFKKDVIYRLGRAYEENKEMDKYLACMMEIYEVDSGFSDVATRVEGSYS